MIKIVFQILDMRIEDSNCLSLLVWMMLILFLQNASYSCLINALCSSLNYVLQITHLLRVGYWI